MNRLSTHNKYVLKEGKYIRQSAEDQQLFSHRTHSEVNNSVEGQTKSPVNVDDSNLKLYNSSRQPLYTEMASSSILPRKFEYMPKHFVSKKIGKDLYSSGQHSPLRLNEEHHRQIHTSRVIEPSKLLRVPFEFMPVDTKSNCSDDIDYIDTARYTIQPKSIIQDETASSKIQNFTQGQFQLRLRIGSTEITGNVSRGKKEKGEQYRMSPQQQVVWLKRMLQDKTNDVEKLFNENDSLKTEIAFLKERIISFQRANHILETENAKIKMQLFSEQELIQLCCPEQGLGDYARKDISANHMEQELQRIKAEIQQLETQGFYSDTRSEVLNHKAGTHTNQKIIYLKKMLAQKKNVLDAHHIGSESKESMKRYITNIIQRSKADHKIIVQLRNQINSKEKIITEMDQLIHDISQQLASCKNQLSKHLEIEAPKTISKSMRQSFITSATTIGTSSFPSENRLNLSTLNSGIMKMKYGRYDQEERFSVRIIEPDADNSRVKKRLEWDVEDSDITIRKLKQEMNEKQRVIEHYQRQLMRLSYNNQQSIPQKYGKVVTEIQEVDYVPKVNPLSSLLKMKQKKIGGQNSKASILSVKRASTN